MDGSGNVFVADTGNNRIDKFDSTGTFLLTFGWGVKDGATAFEICTSGCQIGNYGFGDGRFYFPLGVAVDGSGNVFVADTSNSRVQEFDNTGTFLTAWGGYGTGAGEFEAPTGIAVDASGSVFVTDTGYNRIQKFTNTGTFLTMWGSFGSGNGQFDSPYGVALDGSGNVFVVDVNNNRIEKFGCPL